MWRRHIPWGPIPERAADKGHTPGSKLATRLVPFEGFSHADPTQRLELRHAHILPGLHVQPEARRGAFAGATAPTMLARSHAAAAFLHVHFLHKGLDMFDHLDVMRSIRGDRQVALLMHSP
jgi:hypothetical protein